MLDYIWVLIMILALFGGVFCSGVDSVSEAVAEGSASAINLIISTAGMICFWSGIMEVADKSSLTTAISKILSPILRKLFKNISADSSAMKYISMNISANLMGLGNAATPLGLSAMKELKKNHNSNIAADNMILFVVLNTASIQILPTTICAYRSTYLSSAPFEILPAVWITSIASVCVGLIVAKCLMPVGRSRL